jgi:AAA ATPase containing von Willebrand factor type A (vWA) domain
VVSSLDLSSARPTSSPRGRGGRSSRGRRRTIGSTTSTPRRNGVASGRGRGGRSRTSRGSLAAPPAKDGLEAPSPLRQELSPVPTASVDEDVEGDEALDEVDKELAGGPAASLGRARVGPGEEDQGYEDSFIGEGGEGEADVDEDAEALSSENEDDEEQEEEAEDEDLEEGDENENESTYEGGNGYAASESSEPEADVEGEAEAEVEGDEAGEGGDDETMDDQ